MSSRYVSLQEAAEMLAVSAKTVRRFIAKGELPAYTLGKRGAGSGRPIRIRLDDLEALSIASLPLETIASNREAPGNDQKAGQTGAKANISRWRRQLLHEVAS